MHRILIVDDEKISLRMTDHILSTEYKTFCASSASEAMRVYEENPADLVLSDLRMPEIDGFELQQMMQRHFNRTIPFIFMSSDKKSETESRGLSIGALDFIKKPFRADVLLRRVANIFATIEQVDGLKKAAVTDPMTGLLNKASSHEEIDIICKKSSGALMMVDLDNFKPVNDIYGHDMGDRVLIRFAEILRSAIRSTDLAGRMGGDEFVIFCQNVNDEEVIAEKASYINEQILLSAKELMGEDMTIPLGASIGCAFAPIEGKDFLTLFKKADKALYDVKKNGKHGYKVYVDSKLAENNAINETTALSAALSIIGERSTDGAMVLPIEQFKIVYRFQFRVIKNYKRNAHVILFSVKTHGDKDLEVIMEDLIQVMKSTLRQSDVLAQYSKNQVILMILKATHLDMDVVIERIMMNWEASESSEHCSLSYEMTDIQG